MDILRLKLKVRMRWIHPCYLEGPKSHHFKACVQFIWKMANKCQKNTTNGQIALKRHLGVLVCHSGVGCINRGIGKGSQGYWLGLTGSIERVKKTFFPILTHHMSLFEGFASSLSVLLQIDSKNKLLCLLLLCTKAKVKNSQKQFFFKLHCPKRNWKFLKDFCCSI